MRIFMAITASMALVSCGGSSGSSGHGNRREETSSLYFLNDGTDDVIYLAVTEDGHLLLDGTVTVAPGETIWVADFQQGATVRVEFETSDGDTYSVDIRLDTHRVYVTASMGIK